MNGNEANAIEQLANEIEFLACVSSSCCGDDGTLTKNACEGFDSILMNIARRLRGLADAEPEATNVL